MTEPAILTLDISPFWRHLQDQLLRIVGVYPEDKLNWSPKAELWNARGILIHVSDVRDYWLANGVQDGDAYPNIWLTARTKEDLSRELVRTFDRLTRFLTNAQQLDAMYASPGSTDSECTGHWLAFELLEHDIHHRAELLQRLALLDVTHDIYL